MALLGVNGAGKTTMLECIEGLRSYDSGTITINGKIGIQLQSSALQGYIKPMEAVKLFAKWNKTVPDNEMLKSLGIPELSKKKYTDLSTGQKRRLHLALALIGNPDIIFLDEPTAGLDPKERVRVREQIKAFAGDKIILVSTHVVSDIAPIAKEILLIRSGNMIDRDTVENLCRKYGESRDLEEVYMHIFGEEERHATADSL